MNKEKNIIDNSYCDNEVLNAYNLWLEHLQKEKLHYWMERNIFLLDESPGFFFEIYWRTYSMNGMNEWEQELKSKLDIFSTPKALQLPKISFH